jgi:hypothetical protein
MTEDTVNMDVVQAIVQTIMSAPPQEATQGEVIIAVCKSVALVAHMIGSMRKNQDSYAVLNDMLDLIEDYHNNQTVVVTEYTEN